MCRKLRSIVFRSHSLNLDEKIKIFWQELVLLMCVGTSLIGSQRGTSDNDRYTLDASSSWDEHAQTTILAHIHSPKAS